MPHEEKPPISLASDQAVDDMSEYYDDRQPNQWVNLGLTYPFGVLAYRSKSVFESGAEEVIHDHTKEGGRLLLSLHHVFKSDPFVIAGVAAKRRALWSLVGNTNVTAKPSLHVSHPVVRWFLDSVDAQPAFRKADKNNPAFGAQGTEEEIDARIHRAGDGVVRNSIKKLDQGGHVANFAGRGRWKEGDKPITPDKLSLGVGRIACGVADRSKVLVVPAAVNYDRGLWRPSVAFAYPIEVVDTATPELVVASAAMGMQKAREMATELAEARRFSRFVSLGLVSGG